MTTRLHLHRLRHRVVHLPVEIVVLVFIFWILQTILWMAATIIVPFTPLANSILYTIEISHWALVLSCATAATATWAIMQTRHQGTEIHAIEKQEREDHPR